MKTWPVVEWCWELCSGKQKDGGFLQLQEKGFYNLYSILVGCQESASKKGKHLLLET